MRTITLKIDAGAFQDQPVQGIFVRNGDASPTIVVEARKGGEIIGSAYLEAGDLIRFARAYDHLMIVHEEATTQTVTILAGHGELTTSRVAGTVAVDGTVSVDGTVEVIDAEQSKVLAGAAFVVAGVWGAVAGQYAHAQLWNPVGSGKHLVVRSIVASAGAAAGVVLNGYMSTQLTTLVKNAASKYVAAPVSASELRSQSSATLLFTGMGSIEAQANQGGEMLRAAPLILPEGYGVAVAPYQVNTALSAQFEFEEQIA